MWASSGCWTIGASTPSTSSSTAERAGSSFSGRSSSSSVAVGSAPDWPSMRAMRRTLQLAVIGTAAGIWSGPVRRRRRDRDRAAARAVARLRRARGDGHVAGGDRDHRASRPSRCRPATATSGPATGWRSACPAVGGVLAGTWLQQRIPTRWITYGFCALPGRHRAGAAAVIEVLGILLLGFGAGLTAGLFGVGGGILAVLALTLVLGLDQLEAQATSLVSIVPVALVGAWRQHRYGNLRLRRRHAARRARGGRQPRRRGDRQRRARAHARGRLRLPRAVRRRAARTADNAGDQHEKEHRHDGDGHGAGRRLGGRQRRRHGRGPRLPQDPQGARRGGVRRQRRRAAARLRVAHPSTTSARRSCTSSCAGRSRCGSATSGASLGPGGLARVDAATVRGMRNTSDSEEATYVCVGGAGGYVGRDGVPDEGSS